MQAGLGNFHRDDVWRVAVGAVVGQVRPEEDTRDCTRPQRVCRDRVRARHDVHRAGTRIRFFFFFQILLHLYFSFLFA